MSTDYTNLPYRSCVGIFLINDENKVFVGERLDNPGSWQMPQGGVNDGEKLEDAAFREMREETGTDNAKTLRVSEQVYTYDLPHHLLGKLWQGKYKGQEQRWIAFKFTGEDREITLYDGVHPEFMNYKWVDIDNICDYIVPFKQETYQSVIAEFRDLVD
ncbi:MAG: RNA pyrophosphohydrolase [Alphaproteobacteria bacterium]|nr:MAG: RNA pyrophosphohydrolase [Alphaproteobacteria bacterium]